MKVLLHIAMFCTLSLVGCTIDTLPEQGYVQVFVDFKDVDSRHVLNRKGVDESYLDDIDVTTFSTYFFHSRTHNRTAMPDGYHNPTPLNDWGMQDSISLFEGAYDVIVANVNPYTYDAQTDEYLPTLNPNRGVIFVSETQNAGIAPNQLCSLEFTVISSAWNLQTCLVDLYARDTICVNEFNALHDYKIYVGDLLMVDSNRGNDQLPYSPKRLSVKGVQGYLRPLLSGESYDVRMEYSRDGINQKVSMIQSAITDDFVAGEELSLVLENVGDSFTIGIESPDGETEIIGEIDFKG